MAILKQRWDESASYRENYIKSKEYYGSTIGCDIENVSEDFLLVQKTFNKTNGNETIHIVQSWGPEESKRLTREEVNQMGRELIEKAYQGHQAFIGTHTDTDKIHNHIMLNPVNMETGQRLHNKKFYQEYARDFNDQICIKHGLSVTKRSDTVRPKSVNYQIEKDGRFSHSLDIEKKALFASKYARSFQEQALIMREFGIETKIQNKNTSYRHPEQQRFKRGAKLNKELTQESLHKKFEQNKEKYKGKGILEIAKEDDAFNKLKAITIQKEAMKKREFVDDAVQIKHFKNKKIEGIILINEKGEKFFVNKKDEMFDDLKKTTSTYKGHIINKATEKQAFLKSGKMVFKTEDGHEIWIDKKTDPKTFKEHRVGGYYNLKRFKHYYLNSNYRKNRPLKTSKKERESYQRRDVGHIEKVLKDNPHIENMELIEHEKTSFFNGLITKHKKVNFIFQGKSVELEKVIEETLSR